MPGAPPRVVAVIPARMGSSRFPGKPLALLLGRTMIEHVYRRTVMCESLDDVWIATCDQEIVAATERFGGKAIMTSDKHERASDRVAEVATKIDADIFVLIQGDEPMTIPSMIERAVRPMQTDPLIGCINLAKRITRDEEYQDPNTIKVVTDLAGDALYFSRSPIPTSRIKGFAGIPVLKQVCIIPFRRDVILKYAELTPTPLEQAESIDMLRFLEHGMKVRMIETDVESHSVDNEQDRQRVEQLLRHDPLTRHYVSL